MSIVGQGRGAHRVGDSESEIRHVALSVSAVGRFHLVLASRIALPCASSRSPRSARGRMRRGRPLGCGLVGTGELVAPSRVAPASRTRGGKIGVREASGQISSLDGSRRIVGVWGGNAPPEARPEPALTRPNLRRPAPVAKSRFCRRKLRALTVAQVSSR